MAAGPIRKSPYEPGLFFVSPEPGTTLQDHSTQWQVRPTGVNRCRSNLRPTLLACKAVRQWSRVTAGRGRPPGGSTAPSAQPPPLARSGRLAASLLMSAGHAAGGGAL